MPISKVVYGNRTLIDLSADTAHAGDVHEGYSFHDSSGALVNGTFDFADATSGTATSADLPYGKSLWVNGQLLEGEFTVPTFADGTDEEIATALQLHYAGEIDLTDYWSVGDTRKIHLDAMQAPNPNSSNTWQAQDITVVIVAMNHNDLETPINGITKAVVTVQTREILSSSSGKRGDIYINGNSSVDYQFKKWSELYMRTYLNSIVLNAFPSGLKSLIKPSKHYRHVTHNGSTSEEVIDNLFLPSCPEIYGTGTVNYYTATNPTEGTQFEYFQTTSNRMKKINNNGSPASSYERWWSGSPSNFYDSDSSIRYCWELIMPDGTVVFITGAQSYGLAPAFCL